MGIEGEGKAKLLLFGEHSVVYGFPAVGISLDERIRVELHMDGSSEWKLTDVVMDERATILLLLSHFECLVPEMKGSGRGRIKILSSIPRSLGFGSSAALCTALASALFVATERTETGAWGEQQMQKIWEWSHRGEQLFHGTASGIDTGLSLLSGLLSFTPRSSGLPAFKRMSGFSFFLVVGAVPRMQSTRSSVTDIANRVSEGSPDVKARLSRLGEIAQQAINILERREHTRMHELAELAQKAHGLLNDLGLGSPDMDFLLNQGYKAGALGGKMSGAGRGGAFFLFMPDRESALEAACRLRHAAKQRGLSTFRTIRAVMSQGSPSCSG